MRFSRETLSACSWLGFGLAVVSTLPLLAEAFNGARLGPFTREIFGFGVILGILASAFFFVLRGQEESAEAIRRVIVDFPYKGKESTPQLIRLHFEASGPRMLVRELDSDWFHILPLDVSASIRIAGQDGQLDAYLKGEEEFGAVVVRALEEGTFQRDFEEAWGIRMKVLDYEMNPRDRMI